MLAATALQALLLAFPALFSIVNPLAGAIIFNEVTAAQSHAERVALARRVAFYAMLVMVITLLCGTYILSFFGITLNALRIAGGIVVSVRAYEMLSAPQAQTDRKQAEAEPVLRGSAELANYAFFPLTLPFTTGPGTIAVAVSLGAERPAGLLPAALFYAGATAAALAMAVLIWLLYTTADRLAAVLGTAGRQAVSRLAAFLLLGIGVQIVLSGVIPVVHAAMQYKQG
jgi:multiple antibiotic resistance protein